MSTKKQNANVHASIYFKDFDFGFECSGAQTCRFALCAIMPPTGEDECAHQYCGSCKNPVAQYAALESLGKRIKKHLKEMEDHAS